MIIKQTFAGIAVAGALAWAGAAGAAVTAEEAAKLKTTLTPMGAERAGNKEGTIPSWEGGYTKQIPGAVPGSGKIDPDPFPQEKPLLRITAKNAAQYADKLNPGTLELLKMYPDTFYLEVYPTHRTAAFSQSIYDNTFKNATTAKITHEGRSLTGAYGGTPFPIPKSGIEVIWNHLLFPRNPNADFDYRNLVGASNGKRTLAARLTTRTTAPYYYENGRDKFDGRYAMSKLETSEPPFKAGELLVIWDSLDESNDRQAWQYLVGQRRVRRAPTVGYDTPDFVASGANYFDEVEGFYGSPSRYTWKLVGKKEMYIPYNNNAYVNLKIDDAFGAYHENMAKFRWELHRMWVVEANLAPGKRHVVPKRVFYVDEDSWTVILADGYDAAGKLWRTAHAIPFIMPSIGGTFYISAMIFNLQAKTYSAIQCFNEGTIRVPKMRPLSYYAPEALGAEGVR